MAVTRTYDEDQKRAMLDESAACLVKANVGSGKTAVLTGKVRYLHGAKMVEYPDMAVLTFTNRAADEIRLRLQIADEMRSFGTFHSVALNLLRKELPVETLGYTKDFQVITPEEELDMAQILIAEHGLKVKYQNRLKKRLEQYQASIRAGKTTEDATKAAGSRGNTKPDDLAKLAELLSTEKVHQDKMSFTDLIENAVTLLRELKNKLNSAQDVDKDQFVGYTWILVDEVQDCDALQLDFIDALMDLRPYGQKPRFFAVGDPGQVIYSWRGSTLNVFYVLKERYHATELTLSSNYRSAAGILDVASKFQMSGNKIVPSRDSGKAVVVREHYDALSEAEYLADRIKEIHDGTSDSTASSNNAGDSNGTEDGDKISNTSVPWRQIAVFYRLQSQADILEKVLIRNGIPCDVSGRRDDEIPQSVKWVLRVIRAAVCPADTVAKRLALGDDLAKPMVSELESQIDDFGEICRAGDIELKNAEDLYKWFDFDSHLHPSAETYEKDSAAVMEVLQQAMDGYKAGISEERNGTWSVGDLTTHLKDYLDRAALGGLSYRQDDHVDRRDAVRLMTLHASKGLEFKYVFIIGLNDGLLPLSGGDDIDEEMRLFYVGITRAKDELELSYYTNPAFHGAREGAGRFLKMIPDKLVEKPDEKNGPTTSLHDLRRMVELARKAGQERKVDQERTPDQERTADHKEQILYGEKPADIQNTAEPEKATEPAEEANTPLVTHPHYGQGMITSDDGISITVNFEGYGEKSFVRAFCDWLDT